MSEAAPAAPAAPTPPPPPAAPPAAPAAPEAPWHGLTEPDAQAYVNNKGWKTPADIVKSYQGAEKLIGRDPNTLLTIPRPDDPAGFRAVMAKLGLPESPDKYELDVPQGVTPDEGYQKWARETFHKLGLPAQVVKELTKEHNAYVANTLGQQQKDYDLKVAGEKSDLLKEWGAGHERMMAAAKAAAGNLGFNQQMIDAMESSIGYAGTMKFFASLGQKLGESSFATGQDKGAKFGTGMTPEEARVEFEAMKLDATVRAALLDGQHPGHKAAVEKQQRLFKYMYPDE